MTVGAKTAPVHNLGFVPEIEFTLNAAPVVVPDDGCSLLEALRDRLGVRSAKDGCAPQGQCGCCTVWVDGQPRVACVTPAARVRHRQVTTVEGLDQAVAERWSEALLATGGSQCGFCTPGIVMRLAATPPGELTREGVGQSLLAHLCRCTGWDGVVEAALIVRRSANVVGAAEVVDEAAAGATSRHSVAGNGRDLEAAAKRAEIEGGVAQRVGTGVVLGHGGFADDAAPPDALVAMRRADGEWVVAETTHEARRLAGKVQGRRTTIAPSWPIEVAGGDWDRVLHTTWVEPAYLEPDATWCVPGGEAASTVGNGGAFGGKLDTGLGAVARELADRHGRPVRVLSTREDVVRLGPKRPPMAIGVRSDGTGVVRVARTPGIATAIAAVAPGLMIEEVDVVGPSTSAALRGAGWAEVAAVLASLAPGPDAIVSPGGGRAVATIGADGRVAVAVRCGRPLDTTVLRSYCVGAAHMALGWVRSEAIAVGEAGEPLDLTVRSFGVLRAVDTPPIEVIIEDDDGPPVNGSDAVFAAVAAAAWRAAGFPPRWPIAG